MSWSALKLDLSAGEAFEHRKSSRLLEYECKEAQLPICLSPNHNSGIRKGPVAVVLTEW
jgi:hypothetical protein